MAFCGVLVIVKPLSSQSPHHHLSVCKCAMLIGFFFLITPPGHTNKVATKVYAKWSLHYHGFIITGVHFLPSTLPNSDTGTLELYENFPAVDFNQDWLPFLSFKYTCYSFKTVRPPRSRIKTDWWKGGFLFFLTSSLSVMEVHEALKLLVLINLILIFLNWFKIL